MKMGGSGGWIHDNDICASCTEFALLDSFVFFVFILISTCIVRVVWWMAMTIFLGH